MNEMSLSNALKVFTAFSFLKAKSADLFWYQWIYPTAMVIVGYTVYLIIPEKSVQIDGGKIIGDINSLMGILVGFYIAALAAVSSFTNENLDQLMKGRAPVIRYKRQGRFVDETLTRRRFLSVLFGYCAVVSISLYAFGVMQAHIKLSIPLSLPDWVGNANMYAHNGLWLVYNWFLASLFVTTMLGLHYLVERMHRA